MMPQGSTQLVFNSCEEAFHEVHSSSMGSCWRVGTMSMLQNSCCMSS